MAGSSSNLLQSTEKARRAFGGITASVGGPSYGSAGSPDASASEAHRDSENTAR